MFGPLQNLGFLVFSRFSWFSWFYLGILGFPAKNQELLGCFWISSKKPRFTRVCWDFQQKTKNYYGFFGFPAKKPRFTRLFFNFQQKNKNSQVKQGKPRKPRENQESKILSWARHLHENLGFLDSWFSRGFLGFLDFTWEFLDFQQKTKNY